MKLRVCLEGVCFLKAFCFTAADLKRGLCFSSSSCRSARREPDASAFAGTLYMELFLGPDSEAVPGTRPRGEAALSLLRTKQCCTGAARVSPGLAADKHASLLPSSFPYLEKWSAVMQASAYQHSDLNSARTEPDFMF